MIHVATCVYGIDDKMFEMLKVYAYSVLKNVRCELFIYTDGITLQQASELSFLSDRLNLVSFKEQRLRKNEKASQKVRIWKEISSDPLHEKQPLVISDFDMLFLKDVSRVFEVMDRDQADLCYTLKDQWNEKYRLNTGILFLNNPRNCRQIMRAWAADVTRSLNNAAVAESMASSHGSVDQCVLMSWLESDNAMCKTHSLPASQFNLHKDWSNIPEDCCVIHYKSDWSKVLTTGDSFRRCLEYHGWWKREEARTWKPAFDLWKEYQQELENSQTSL